jgi:peptidoglycan hydrolase-like protein with peptidoglycan-binding domain
MTKSGLIVSLCFVLASGCALFDGSEMPSEQPSVPAPVVEIETITPVVVHAPPPEAMVAPVRRLTRDAVRGMQLRLRELGFDPGPADGIAGAKTKAAFSRFQTGCSKIKPLVENLSGGTAQSSELRQAVNEVPSRQETQTMQTQLRDAGFNPGPVDGIFGDRTRAVLAQLKANCPTARDFAEMLDHPAGATDKQSIGSQTRENNATKPQPLSAAGRSDVIKQAPAPAPVARSQEEIRILQLRLRDAGFDPGPFDGVMGPKTKAALAQYQVAQRGNNAKLPAITGSSGHY